MRSSRAKHGWPSSKQWRRAAAESDDFRKRCTKVLVRARTRKDQDGCWVTRWSTTWSARWRTCVLILGGIIEGVRAVYQQALSVLGAAWAFPAATTPARPFDPALHEAIGTIATRDWYRARIAQVVRPGYGADDEILAPCVRRWWPPGAIDGRDACDVLSISRNADQSEIQQAYRELAQQHHPDVNKDPSADAGFKEIPEAYNVLSDPERRKRYDAFGEDFRRVPPDVSPEEWQRARAYAGDPGRRGEERAGR